MSSPPIGVPVSLDFPTPMHDGHVRPQKTGRELEGGHRGVFEATAQQAHMEGLEVGPAVQVGSSDGYEIDILGHDFCESVAVVLRPGVTELLWQFAHRLFVRPGLGKSASG